LFVGAALQLGFGVEALSPCLLADCAAAIGFIFVEGDELGEVELFVEDVLKGWGDVITVVVAIVMGMVVMLVVAV
jgi:hypothetical protein